jgi:pimeloyl-ACP methyl ester carboxylesterase
VNQSTDIDGVRWTYSDTGAGPVVVLLHGLAADTSSWDHLGTLLAREHRIICIELPGYSLRSDRADPPAPAALALSLDAMLAQVLAEPSEASVPSVAPQPSIPPDPSVLAVPPDPPNPPNPPDSRARITLVGHSFGASVAMMAAHYSPERYLALVLIAPGGFGIEVSPVLSVLSTRAGMAAVRVLHTRAISRSIHRAADRIARVQTERPAYSLDGVMAAYERLGDRAARDQLRRAARQVLGARRSANPRAAAQLPAQVPVLIIWGAQDHVLPAWHADAAKKLLPWSEVRLIDQAGHTPHQTHPGEVQAMIDGFLASPAVLARAGEGAGDTG